MTLSSFISLLAGRKCFQAIVLLKKKKELNSVALVRKRNIPIERPPLSAKLVPNLRIEGVVWTAQQIPTAVNLDFLDPEPFVSYPHEAEWTPFQSHYFSENVVAPGIESRICGPVARNSDH
jgi:hypothetical protein